MDRLQGVAIKAVIAVVLGILAGYAVSHWRASLIDQGRKEQAAVDAKNKKVADDKAAEELSAINARAAVLTKQLQELQNARETERITEKASYEKALSVERRRALDGNSGLRCPTSAGSSPNTAFAIGNRALAAAPGSTARTDLVPRAADAVLSIAANSAELVRDYNEVIALYNDARNTCNAKL